MDLGKKYPLLANDSAPVEYARYPVAIQNEANQIHLNLAPSQQWMPSLEEPYPYPSRQNSHAPYMSYDKVPSPQQQICVNYNGRRYLQGLSPGTGPYMLPTNIEHNRGPVNSYERKHAKIMYPTTHSYPGPYLQSYIRLPNKMYMY